MEAQLDPLFQREVEAGRIPGAAAIALDATGNVLFSKAYGTTDVSNPKAPPVTTETPTTLFSFTKLVTAVAALQLIEQGKLDLHAPAEQYVPDIKEIKLLKGFGEDGTPVLVQPTKKITVLHLLTHTSGFTYDFFDKPTFQWRVAVGQTPMSYAITAVKQDFSSPLVAEPGEKYIYGVGFDWISFIIESITGLRLDKYVAQHITQPLGLRTLVTELSEEQDRIALNIHAKDADGKLMPTPIRMPKNPEVSAGGHGMYGSCADFCQFLLTILNNGTHPSSGVKILEANTVKKYIFTDLLPQIGCSTDGIGELTAAMPQATNEGVLLPGVKKGHSMGAMLNMEDAPTGRRAGSIAWACLSNSCFWIDPTEGKLGCVLSATLPFVDKDVLGLFDALERAVYGKPQAGEFGEKGSNFEMW